MLLLLHTLLYITLDKLYFNNTKNDTQINAFSIKLLLVNERYDKQELIFF